MANIPFNHTFTSDKPIYYPSTWESGKTAVELYQQFKQTTTFWLMRNTTECISACMWVFICYVVIESLRQIRRLYQLDNECLEKKHNQKFLTKKFFISTSILTSFVTFITIGLLILTDWTRLALFKGVIAWIVILITKFIYSKITKSLQNKNSYQKLKVDE